MIARAWRIPGAAYIRGEVVDQGLVIYGRSFPEYAFTTKSVYGLMCVQRDAFQQKRREA